VRLFANACLKLSSLSGNVHSRENHVGKSSSQVRPPESPEEKVERPGERFLLNNDRAESPTPGQGAYLYSVICKSRCCKIKETRTRPKNAQAAEDTEARVSAQASVKQLWFGARLVFWSSQQHSSRCPGSKLFSKYQTHTCTRTHVHTHTHACTKITYGVTPPVKIVN
jgi:hypothetical protein